MKELDLLRKQVVKQGRGMVRVRWKDSKELLTAAVCPGCWNDANKRHVLLKRMHVMGVEPVHKDDKIDGVYRKRQHSPYCPQKKKIEKSWKDFERAVKQNISRKT